MQSDTLTLYGFLEQTGADVRAYDIGRRIGIVERDQFLAFENLAAPYPLPMQRKAWFALLQLPPGKRDDPVIWLLGQVGDSRTQGFIVMPTGDVGDTLVADEAPLVPTGPAAEIVQCVFVEARRSQTEIGTQQGVKQRHAVFAWLEGIGIVLQKCLRIATLGPCLSRLEQAVEQVVALGEDKQALFVQVQAQEPDDRIVPFPGGQLQ